MQPSRTMPYFAGARKIRVDFTLPKLVAMTSQLAGELEHLAREEEPKLAHSLAALDREMGENAEAHYLPRFQSWYVLTGDHLAMYQAAYLQEIERGRQEYKTLMETLPHAEPDEEPDQPDLNPAEVAIVIDEEAKKTAEPVFFMPYPLRPQVGDGQPSE